MKRKLSEDPNPERTEKKANPPLDKRMVEAAVSSDLEAAKTLSTMASLEAARSPMPSAADRSTDILDLQLMSFSGLWRPQSTHPQNHHQQWI